MTVFSVSSLPITILAQGFSNHLITSRCTRPQQLMYLQKKIHCWWDYFLADMIYVMRVVDQFHLTNLKSVVQESFKRILYVWNACTSCSSSVFILVVVRRYPISNILALFLLLNCVALCSILATKMLTQATKIIHCTSWFVQIWRKLLTISSHTDTG